MRRYESYKPSGVPWIPDIPDHWNLVPNRSVLQLKKKLVGTDSATYPLLSLTKQGIIPRDMENLEGKVPASFDTYQVIEPGNLIFCLFDIDETPRAVGISELHGMITSAYTRFSCDPTIARYVYYFYVAMDNHKRLKPLYTGLRKTIQKSSFLSAKLPLPPLDEQRTIVRYLDKKLEQIDTFIKNKRRLTALLEEQKAVIVNRAVTKGLDSRIRMKDSGVEWLGQIPSHWDALKLSFIAESLQTGPFGSQLHSGEYVEGQTPVINPSNMKNGRIVPDITATVDMATALRLARHRLKNKDILFARRGEMGRCALVTEKEEGWLCGTGSLRLHPDSNRVNSEYLVLAISTKGVAGYLSLVSVGSTMDNLNTSILGRLSLPIPPLREQLQIVECVESESALVNLAIEKANQEIALINEYRTTLISEVVTGKIDVRTAA